MINSNHLKAFVERIDPSARPLGNYEGISQIYKNYQTGTVYFIHRIDEFWNSFGKYYPKIGGIGISVDKGELNYARKYAVAWTVIAMPYKDDWKFYGLESQKWYDYCEENGTWNNHTAKSGRWNGSISVKMLINMEQVKCLP